MAEDRDPPKACPETSGAGRTLRSLSFGGSRFFPHHRKAAAVGNVKRYRYRERTRVTWLSRSGIPCKQDFSNEETAMAHYAQLKRAAFRNLELVVPPEETAAGGRSASPVAAGGSVDASATPPRTRSGRKRSRPSDRAEAEPSA